MPKKKIDPGLPKECKSRYYDEMIGFEGLYVPMCSNKKHFQHKNIYPLCLMEYCPLETVNNNQ